MEYSKNCQIVTIGENIEWVLRGIALEKVDKLYLIVTNEPEFIKKGDEIISRIGIENLDIRMKVIDGTNILNFITILKQTIYSNSIKGYSISINITSGLRIWQLYAYFISIQLNSIIKNIFIVNKQTKQMITFPNLLLTKAEQEIIDILGIEGNTSRDLIELYGKERKINVSRAFLSKYLSSLRRFGLIESSQNGKKKDFNLTLKGQIYVNPRLIL